MSLAISFWYWKNSHFVHMNNYIPVSNNWKSMNNDACSDRYLKKVIDGTYPAFSNKSIVSLHNDHTIIQLILQTWGTFNLIISSAKWGEGPVLFVFTMVVFNYFTILIVDVKISKILLLLLHRWTSSVSTLVFLFLTE